MIEVLDVQMDSLGPFARVRVHLKDGARDIRWGLDAFSFHHLHTAFQSLAPFRQTASSERAVAAYPRLACEWDADNRAFAGRLFIATAPVHAPLSRANVCFACSTLFAANLRWLERITSVRELTDDLLLDAEDGRKRDESEAWPTSTETVKRGVSTPRHTAARPSIFQTCAVIAASVIAAASGILLVAGPRPGQQIWSTLKQKAGIVHVVYPHPSKRSSGALDTEPYTAPAS